jgi:hypothetical protein
MPSRRAHRKISVDNAKNAHRHSDEWWEACSRVDEAKLRLEIKREGDFLTLRVKRLCYFGRPLESWERQVLKELIAKEQLRRYKRWQRMELIWKRRGVEF